MRYMLINVKKLGIAEISNQVMASKWSGEENIVQVLVVTRKQDQKKNAVKKNPRL